MESRDKGDVLLDETWQRLVALAQQADKTFKIRQRYQAVRQLAVEYPLATVCIVVFLAACSVPLLCFIAFAAVSTIITFCGFLFVEGKMRFWHSKGIAWKFCPLEPNLCIYATKSCNLLKL